MGPSVITQFLEFGRPLTDDQEERGEGRHGEEPTRYVEIAHYRSTERSEEETTGHDGELNHGLALEGHGVGHRECDVGRHDIEEVVTRCAGVPGDGQRSQQERGGQDESEWEWHDPGRNGPELFGGVEPIGSSIAQIVDEVETTGREGEGHEGLGGVAQGGATRYLSGGGGRNDDETIFDPLAWPEGTNNTSQEIAGLRHA